MTTPTTPPDWTASGSLSYGSLNRTLSGSIGDLTSTIGDMMRHVEHVPNGLIRKCILRAHLDLLASAQKLQQAIASGRPVATGQS